jgi:glutathione synthase/RimK-type ligase-like ATP-grasp enzyme
MQDIYIIHENEEWLMPLQKAFADRGIHAKEWFLKEGQVDLDAEPPKGVFYNRMSASSHTRGNRFAPELTRATINWLELHNRKVFNGSRAIYYEVDKFSQYCALHQHGILTPKTVAVIGKTQLVDAALSFNQLPFIIKPNRGGKGLGVKLIRSIEEFENFLGSDEYEEPLDGTWLIQEYIQSEQTYITRAEFVDCKFLYTVKVNTESGFELCPADVCEISDAFCPTTKQESKFKIIHDYDQHPLIAQLEKFLQETKIDIAGIEFIENQQGQLLVYDINTNTNYNGGAENKAGLKITAMESIAELLITSAG